MPLYEYRCQKCGHIFEKIQKFSDPPVTDCPQCQAKGKVEQLLSAPAVQFKGSGWYATDYAKKSHAKGGEKKTEVKAESGSEKKTETKTETKSSDSGDKKKS